jgi:hypothetical protein
MIPVRLIAYDAKLGRHFQAYRNEDDGEPSWSWKPLDRDAVTAADLLIPLPGDDVRNAPRQPPRASQATYRGPD